MTETAAPQQPPAPPPAPAKPSPAPAPAPSGPLSEQEQATLASLQARQATSAVPGGTVSFKVEGDHDSITFGGVTVGTEFTPVPASIAAALVEAAANAGVTITQES